MKKTLLAIAISAFGANAFAAPVDYTAGTPTFNTIATELALPAAGLVTTTDTLTWDLGFSVTTATQRFIKVTLSNGAKFTANPTIVADGTPGVFSQGGAGTSSVIFEVTPGVNLDPTDNVVLTLANLNLTGKTEVGAQYQLFETAVDAVNGTNALVNKPTAPYIKFGTGLKTAFAPASVQRVINVAATPTATSFTGALDANSARIGAVSVDVVTGLVNYSVAAVTLAQLVAAGTALEVDGDFSAALGGVGTASSVRLNGTAVDGAGTSANTLTATKATFVLNDTAVGDPNVPTNIPVVYHVTGTTAIVPSVYNGQYNVVPVTGTTTASVNFGKIGELAKNGATMLVDLALTPGGTYSNYVRISNKTSVGGNVFITVITDNGDQQTISLGEVAGQTNSLAARSSTAQMSIQAIFDAAAAKGLVNPTGGKLRLVVDGEFPATGSTTNANDYGLSVQTYTVAKDGNSFATF